MATWTQVGGGLGATYQMTYAGSRAFAATSSGVFYSDDNAATWTQATGISYANGIVHAGSDVVIVASKVGGVIGGSYGAVYRSTDNGETFSDWSTDFPTTANDTCANVTALGLYAYAFSSYNGVYRRTLASGNWAAYNTGITVSLPDEGMAGGQLFTDGTSIFTALYGSGELDVPELYKLVPAEGTWTQVKELTTSPNNLTKAPAIISTTMYVASNSGQKVIYSEDGGGTWSDVGGSCAAYNVAANANINYLFAAVLSTVKQSINGGTVWTDITGNLPVSNNCYYVYVAGFYLYASLLAEEALYRTPLEIGRPDEVDDLSIAISTNPVLTWTAATDASTYEVYRSDTCQSLFTQADTVTITSAMISGSSATNITVGNEDYYEVDGRFYDTDGNIYIVTSITGGVSVTKQNAGTFDPVTDMTMRFLGEAGSYLTSTSSVTYTDTTASADLGYTYIVVSFNGLGVAGGYGNPCFTDVNDRIVPLSQ